MVVVVVIQVTAEKYHLPEVMESSHVVILANCSSQPVVSVAQPVVVEA
jgi:hypothetical protein